VSAHVLTALLVAAAIAALALASVADALTRRRRFLEDRLILVALGLIVVAIATGAVEAISRTGPRDALHLLYAAGILVVLPVARVAWPTFSDRRRDWLLVGGSALAAGLLVRLAQTG
jgi:hypothetical protein